MPKDIFGLLSIFICVIQYGPLIYLTIKGDKKPHVFTRLVWAIVFGVTAAAQYADQGGAGSWANWTSGLFAVAIALLALGKDKSYVTRSDWISFALALFTIPLWALTHNPFYAALLATLIDLFAYIPMIRKCWNRPYDEMIWGCVISDIKQILSISALAHYSPTTLVYPLATFVAETSMALYLFWRRKAVQ